MSMLTLLLLAVGLAADSCAVAAARGVARCDVRWSEILGTALVFGLFQGGMPVLGWWFGVAADRWFAAFDHWIAFVLLTAIGAHMIREAWHPAPPEPGPRVRSTPQILLLGLATSIDALVAGVSLPLMGLSLLVAAPTIGVVTVLMSILGFRAGCRFGARFGPKVGMLGGAVLIGLGAWTLVEHLV